MGRHWKTLWFCIWLLSQAPGYALPALHNVAEREMQPCLVWEKNLADNHGYDADSQSELGYDADFTPAGAVDGGNLGLTTQTAHSYDSGSVSLMRITGASRAPPVRKAGFLAVEGGIKVVNVGGPLDGAVSSRSLASDFFNVELKAPPAGVQYPATDVGDFNTMDLSAVAGNSVRTIRASNVPFVPVPGGYVLPEALASQASTVGATRIVVSTGSQSVAPLVEGLTSSGWAPVVRNIRGRIIVTATPK